MSVTNSGVNLELIQYSKSHCSISVSDSVTQPVAAVPLYAVVCGPASGDQQRPVQGLQGPAEEYTVGGGAGY